MVLSFANERVHHQLATNESRPGSVFIQQPSTHANAILAICSLVRRQFLQYNLQCPSTQHAFLFPPSCRMKHTAEWRRPILALGVLWAFSIVPLAGAAGDSPDAAALVRDFTARPLGPASMGGRITDIAVVETKTATMYIASASGGLWKTTNNGGTWAPVFDHQSTVSIGDVAVAPSDPNIVWVGTGEANARNSVSWGDGVYKSTDGGQTWENVGVRDSHHIGRIVIHPKDPDIVYVAALGHFWGPNQERGLYKTCNGGKTWTCSKFLSEDCGFVDVVMSPEDPDTLLAAA